MPYMKEAVKWATDYFLKAHVSPTVLYGQVGNGQLDHAFWGRPEDMTMDRPAYKITEANPGSDLVAETSAALAAASILFKDSNPAYSAECLQHSRELYDFANNFRGDYDATIPGVSEFYASYGYYDELAWAAAWLYRATGETSYLTAAKTHFQQLSTTPWEFSWADKTPGVQVLLAQLADEVDKATYVNHLTNFCNDIIDNRQRTPKGLVYLSQWGSLRYAANAVFICLRAADLGINPEKYREFGKQQIHYMLGDTGRSYVVGFGVNPPQRPHHASSSCKPAPATCDWSDFHSPDPNPHVLYGALVGGPDANDWYEDKREDYVKNEVATDYNAGFQSAVAALRSLTDCGGVTAAPTTAAPTPAPTSVPTPAPTSAPTTPNTGGGSGSCFRFAKANSWSGNYDGTLYVTIPTDVGSWSINLQLSSSVNNFQVSMNFANLQLLKNGRTVDLLFL